MVLFLSAACSTPTVEVRPDTEESLLAAPRDQVRAALVSTLETDGYSIRGEEDPRFVRTGYREETRGPWDWLLIWRFGVTRSRVEAVLSADTPDSTRLNVSVIYETKDHLWSLWRETPSPPHRDADLHIRSVKKTLHLL